jgi:glyoxylate reductase
MTRPLVYVTRRLAVDPAAVLGPDFDVAVWPGERAPTRDELLAGAREAEGLLTLLSDPVDDALLAHLPKLKVVANYAVGFDNIDTKAAAARGIWVTNTPDVLTDATADIAFTLLLAVARRVREGERLVREGRFHGWGPTMLLGVDLAGKTLGIFGFGRIGQAMARRARGFGMEVIYTQRSRAPEAVERELGAEKVPFDQLLARSDVISIHCPLTPETRHAFGAAELARMKKGAILVNTGRGPVVDEAALAAALESGHLFGAGLDVYEREPTVHPGLLRRDDVVLLPHLGSAGMDTRRVMAELALTDVARVLRGDRPLHPVNQPASR